jgi:hypothetical protein
MSNQNNRTQFHGGDLVEARSTFTDSSGAVDPDIVQTRVKNPSGHWSPATPTHADRQGATGAYRLDIDVHRDRPSRHPHLPVARQRERRGRRLLRQLLPHYSGYAAAILWE